MSNRSEGEEPQPKAAAGASGMPADFVSITETRIAAMDRKLGYFGEARFVAFYYEPRGEEVVWKDGLSCGFGSGGWRIFFDAVGSLATQCGADIEGSGSPPRHVLLIDRERRVSYFAPHRSADQFLAELCGFPSKRLSCLSPPFPPGSR